MFEEYRGDKLDIRETDGITFLDYNGNDTADGGYHDVCNSLLQQIKHVEMKYKDQLAGALFFEFFTVIPCLFEQIHRLGRKASLRQGDRNIVVHNDLPSSCDCSPSGSRTVRKPAIRLIRAVLRALR